MTDPALRRSRLAVNPIPCWSRGGKIDKSREVFEAAFADFAEIGFTPVKADVPEGMGPEEYLDWISGFGLSPSVVIDFDAVIAAAPSTMTGISRSRSMSPVSSRPSSPTIAFAWARSAHPELS